MESAYLRSAIEQLKAQIIIEEINYENAVKHHEEWEVLKNLFVKILRLRTTLPQASETLMMGMK